MFGLPVTTAINQPLSKKAVYEKFNLKASERERFDADISRLTLVARISTATVPALTEGNEIKGIYVLQVVLKRKEYDPKNILLLQKLIPQNIVFALQHEDKTQLCIFHTRLQQSEWMSTDEVNIPLCGLSLDKVWLNIVATIGGLDNEAEATLEEQIVNREQREKLHHQMEQLEKRCRAEKQTHRRYELHQEILKLKAQLLRLSIEEIQ